MAGDPGRLQQIVWNLLSNAVKFTPKGGKVEVIVERVNSHVEITVNDSGRGIKPEFLPHVFERFRQADASTTRQYGGLGLGLSIVKQLVELHGGHIRATSAGEGLGATFIVSLPMAAVQGDEKREHPTSRYYSALECEDIELDDLRVLVIDDEPDARELIRRVLSQCNAQVITAASCRRRLENSSGRKTTCNSQRCRDARKGWIPIHQRGSFAICIGWRSNTGNRTDGLCSF